MKFLLLIVISCVAHSKSLDEKVHTSEGQKFKIETLTEQKNIIWGFDFLQDGRIIFTERDGFIKIFDPKTKAVTEVTGAPEVWAKGQGGMLDIRVHPKINDKIYISYSEPIKKDATTAVAMATLENNSLKNFKKILTGSSPSDEKIHFGSRIEFNDKGQIFITVGDRNSRDKAQQVSQHNGKVLRLNEDGTIPQDNPFLKDGRAKPEVWSFGHRNPQGLVFDATTGTLWSAEMGPRGGDEINIVKAGVNYGWPVITYGREYYGPKIGEGTAKTGMEQPVAYWVPSISPSAVTIYHGNAFPKWKGNLFIGTLSGEHLRRLTVEGQKITAQEELLKDLDLRIRNVRPGADGYIYFSTDSGLIARLVPVK